MGNSTPSSTNRVQHSRQWPSLFLRNQLYAVELVAFLLDLSMLHWAVKKYLTGQAVQVGKSMAAPLEAQLQVFERLAKILRGSEVASRTGFDRCGLLEDCRALPVSTSTTMLPLWKEIFEHGGARKHQIGRSPIFGFARTSGTNGEAKDIPLNRAYLDSLDRTLARMIACRYHTTGEWDTMFSGKRVLLGSRPLFGESPSGLPICDISGFIPTRTRRYLRHLYAPKYQDLWIQDWTEKVEALLDQLDGVDVLSIVGIPALAMDFSKRACERFGVTHLSQLWPNLTSYIYGGVHLSEEDRSEIRSAWFHRDQPLHFLETYFATEGQLAFTFDPGDSGLALNTLENLYLFREEVGGGDFLFAHELEKGKSYSIYVTTPGGLINYHMGDRIEVVEKRPLLIRVAGREAAELSMTGEKLTLEQFELALSSVGLGSSSLKESLAVVWVESGDTPRIVWGIPEDILSSCPEPISVLTSRLDAALCRFNIHYEEALVMEKVIAPSSAVAIPVHVFDHYQKSLMGVAQPKPKRLFNSGEEFRETYNWDPGDSL